MDILEMVEFAVIRADVERIFAIPPGAERDYEIAMHHLATLTFRGAPKSEIEQARFAAWKESRRVKS